MEQSQSHKFTENILLSGFLPKAFLRKVCKLLDIDSKIKGIWGNGYVVRNKQTKQISAFGTTIAVKEHTDEPSRIIKKLKYSDKTGQLTVQIDKEEAISVNNVTLKNKLQAILSEAIISLENNSESD